MELSIDNNYDNKKRMEHVIEMKLLQYVKKE